MFMKKNIVLAFIYLVLSLLTRNLVRIMTGLAGFLSTLAIWSKRESDAEHSSQSKRHIEVKDDHAQM